MEQELRRNIEKAKNMAAACKINGDEEAPFHINDAGVCNSPIEGFGLSRIQK